MKLINLVFLFILAVCTLVVAQSPRPSQPAVKAKAPASATPVSDNPALLPGPAQIEAALKRTFGYDPSITWQVVDIRPAMASGWAEVVVSINKQPPNRLWVTPDGKNAVGVGEVIPFGPDPFAPARNKLQAADGPSRGAQTPAIMMVDFSDLECPHCKAAQPVVEKLVTDFPQVRLVFQQFPLPASLHPWAMKAALYADCAARADKEAFWKYVDAIFENQGGIALATADDKLKELATTAGLEADKIAACAAAPETEARVKKSMALGESLDINETPTVFINGRRVKSIATIPYDQLKALVQFEIDHAGK
jgi:protein-disulfide isomerase